jgi:hypothetical protein
MTRGIIRARLALTRGSDEHRVAWLHLTLEALQRDARRGDETVETAQGLPECGVIGRESLNERVRVPREVPCGRRRTPRGA